jgi:hypothetical protein
VSVYLALDTLLGELPPDARERLTGIRALLEREGLEVVAEAADGARGRPVGRRIAPGCCGARLCNAAPE